MLAGHLINRRYGLTELAALCRTIGYRTTTDNGATELNQRSIVTSGGQVMQLLVG